MIRSCYDWPGNKVVIDRPTQPLVRRSSHFGLNCLVRAIDTDQADAACENPCLRRRPAPCITQAVTQVYLLKVPTHLDRPSHTIPHAKRPHVVGVGTNERHIPAGVQIPD